MSDVIICSARHDERGKLIGGKAGDQTQKGTPDFQGEVSMQKFYVHTKGWLVLRPIDWKVADKIASYSLLAANNVNLGYNQGCQRKTPDNLVTKVPIGVDCSKLQRDIVFAATGKDPGNFTTANEANILYNTGYFKKPFKFVSLTKTPLYDGDILVTQTKGHTASVVEGNDRPEKLAELAKQETAKQSAQTTPNVNTAKPVQKETQSATKVDAAQSFSTLCKGTFRCKSSLNLRTGAGVNSKILVTMPGGSAVYCYGYYTKVGNVQWLLVTATINKTKYTGFASKTYLTKI